MPLSTSVLRVPLVRRSGWGTRFQTSNRHPCVCALFPDVLKRSVTPLQAGRPVRQCRAFRQAAPRPAAVSLLPAAAQDALPAVQHALHSVGEVIKTGLASSHAENLEQTAILTAGALLVFRATITWRAAAAADAQAAQAIKAAAAIKAAQAAQRAAQCRAEQTGAQLQEVMRQLEEERAAVARLRAQLREARSR